MNTQIRISLQAVPRSLVLLCAILSIFFGIVVISAPGTATLVIVRLLGPVLLDQGRLFPDCDFSCSGLHGGRKSGGGGQEAPRSLMRPKMRTATQPQLKRGPIPFTHENPKTSRSSGCRLSRGVGS
jgi:hypothetical protein